MVVSCMGIALKELDNTEFLVILVLFLIDLSVVTEECPLYKILLSCKLIILQLSLSLL